MLRICLSILCVVSFMVAPVRAADYPDRPITIVVPFGAGGETDIVARLLATSLSKVLDVNVAVQNIVGASGVTGINTVVTAKPDGYQLGFSPSAPLAIHPHLRKVPYSVDNMELIARVMNAPYFLVTQKNSPWNSVDDMVKAMKSEPNKYYWASAGVGSLPYMAIAKVLHEYGIKARHVSFSGDPDAFQALAGDRAQLYATSAGTLANFDIKALAIMSDTRAASQPNTISFKELGKNINVSQWGALFAPKGTPTKILKKLEESVLIATQDPEFIKNLDALDLTAGYLNSADTKEFVNIQSQANAKLIKELNSQK